MEKKGQERKRTRRGMQFIPYDYEAAYNKAIADLNEWFVKQLFSHGKKMVYALKEITAGEQFEIEIYPQFRKIFAVISKSVQAYSHIANVTFSDLSGLSHITKHFAGGRLK